MYTSSGSGAYEQLAKTTPTKDPDTIEVKINSIRKTALGCRLIMLSVEKLRTATRTLNTEKQNQQRIERKIK